MITGNGLNVPRIGEGGRPASYKSKSQSRRDPRVQRRWVSAQDVRPGDCLIGPRTLGIYAILHVGHTETGLVDLTVHTPSGAIRHWIRRPTFQLERA